MPELPDAKLARFTKEYSLSVYDAQILTRVKGTAEFFEEAVKVGKDHEISPKQIANAIINTKIDMANILPAELINNIVSSKKTDIVSESDLQKIIEKVLDTNSKAVNDYKDGKIQVLGFLLGKVKQHFPKADTNQIKNALLKYLRTK